MRVLAIISAGHVQWLTAHMRHEEGLWKRLRLRVLLDDVAGLHNVLEIEVGHHPYPHPLLGMRFDEVSVLGDGFPKAGDV